MYLFLVSLGTNRVTWLFALLASDLVCLKLVSKNQ